MKRVQSALQDLSGLDTLAQRDTWAHRLDPRAKALVTLAYVAVIASFPPRAVVELLPLASYPLVLFLGARLPVRILARPALIALLLALVIGLANPWLDREPIRIFGDRVIAGGWLSLGSILLRAVLCVSAALALIATTGMERLCHGLASLGVPRVAVVQLLFLYRYAFLLGSQSLAMSQARDLRSCGRGLPLSTYGPLVGHLLLRTLDRAERIHQAMCCRGFRGDVPIGNTLAWRWVDAVFLAGWCLCFAVLRWGWLVEGLGGFLLGAQP